MTIYETPEIEDNNLVQITFCRYDLVGSNYDGYIKDLIVSVPEAISTGVIVLNIGI